MSEQRIDELEIKLAYLEMQHQQLNDVVTELQEENRLLKKAYAQLRKQLESAGPERGSAPQDERPPHY